MEMLKFLPLSVFLGAVIIAIGLTYLSISLDNLIKHLTDTRRKQ